MRFSLSSSILLGLPLLVTFQHQRHKSKSNNNFAVVVNALSDSTHSSLYPRQSRNKNGRLRIVTDQALLQCRGGSVSTASSTTCGTTIPTTTNNSQRKKKPHISKKQQRENEEIDKYIDFLIATYCPDEEESCGDKKTTVNSDRIRNITADNQHGLGDSNITTISTTETNITSNAVKVAATVATKRSVKTEQRNGVRRPLPGNSNNHRQDNEENHEISLLSVDGSADTNPPTSDTATTTASSTTQTTFWDQSTTTGMGGGDDGDDDDDNDTDASEEAELLDHYIEFLQEDYDNDRALDRYIDFLEKDYDSDRALDRYIDFLLATTTSSSSPAMTTTAAAVSSSSGSPAMTILASTITTLLPATMAEEQPKEQPQAQEQEPLDAYIDQLVSAVELDEYIDQLVASVSNRELLEETEEQIDDNLATAREEEEEEEEEAVLDSYIETMVAVPPPAEEEATKEDTIVAELVTKEEHDEESATAEAVVSASEKQQVEVQAVAANLADLDAESDDDVVQENPEPDDEADKQQASTQSSATITPSVLTSSTTSETTPVALVELDDEPKEDKEDDSSRVPVSALEMGGDDDGDGDNNDDEEEAIHQDEAVASLVSSTTTSFDDAERDELEDSASSSIGDQITVSSTGKAKTKKKRKKKLTSSGAVQDVVNDTDEELKPGTEAQVQAGEDPASSIPAADEDDKDAAPMKSPNGIYRFLLRQGVVGHVILLALVLGVEWVQLYVPQLAELLILLWTKLAPVGLQRSMAPQLYLPGDGRASAAASLQQLYSGRMPVRGKERTRLGKQADAAALAQLQRIGDIQDAKYKHVSPSFMKRHGLGPYRDDDNDFQDNSLAALKPTSSQKKLKRVRKKKRGTREDDDDYDGGSDDDWVIEGLSSKKGAKSPVETSLKFGVGPTGPSVQVGVELDLGGTQTKRKSSRSKKSSFDAEAIRRDSVRKRTSRNSDRDGGGGVMGMLRAAATSNSLVSRNLLGAYPGDVVPPNEAGDARGLTALARKYGYGEWSSDDDMSDGDDDGASSGKKRASRKKKGKKKSSRSKGTQPDNDPYDIDSILGDDENDTPSRPIRKQKPKGSKRKSTSSANRVSKNSSGSGRSSKASSKKVRPPMELLDETRKRRSKATPTSKKSSSTRSGVEELTKKRDLTAKSSKEVRHALGRLRDLKDLPNKDSEAKGDN